MKAKGSSFGVGCIYIIYTLWFLLMSIDHDKGFFGDSLLINIFAVSFVFAIYFIPTLILGERTRFAQSYPSIVRSLEFWLLFFIATAAPKPLSIERIHEISPNISQVSELIVIGIRSFVSWFSVAFLGTQILMLIKRLNSESSSGNDSDSESVKEEQTDNAT